MSTFNFNFIDDLPESSLVVCASNRLAREIKESVQGKIQPCLNMSIPVTTPKQLGELIHEYLFCRGGETVQLLSRSQFWALMNIKASKGVEEGERLIPAVNEALRSAFQFTEWRLDESFGLLRSFEESRYFADLLGAVRDDAKAREAVLPSDLISWATDRLTLIDQAQLPESVTFYGLMETTPEIEALATKFESMGITVSWTSPTAVHSIAGELAVFPERNDEWNWAADDIRKYLEEGGGGPVALVVDGDESALEAAGAVLRNRLMAGSMDTTGRAIASPVNVGVAKALIEQPLVRDLIGLLELPHIPRPPEAMREILQSRTIAGFLGAVANKLLATLNTGAVPEVTFQALITATESLSHEERAKALQLVEGVSGSAAPYAWFRSFHSVMEKMGWPGGHDLTGLDKQVVDAVAQAMDEWLGIGWVETRWNRFDALRHFKRVLHQTRFNFHTPETPVQVLSPKDAYGLGFDKVWLVGLNEGLWGHPSPMGRFLPPALMRECGALFATADGRGRYARNLLNGLLGQSSRVVLSCAGRDGETLLQPLAFMADAVELVEIEHGEHLWSWLADVEQRVVEDDVRLGALRTNDGEIRGGVALLKNGLACWRRGQLVHRLEAELPAGWSKSLPIRDSSTILHKMEQWFWTDYTQRDLQDHSDEALVEILGGLWDRAAPIHLGWRLKQFDSSQMEREKRQCVEAILRHLRAEQGRPAFEVVNAEKERYATVGPLSFRVIPDRIDRDVSTGKKIVVDYKRTGFGPGAWLGERMSEPQLPITAIASDIEAEGLLVAGMTAISKPLQGLSSGGLGDAVLTAGESRYGGELPWEALVDHWRARLDESAQRLADGEAEANPIDGVTTCSTCPAASICRASHR